MPSTRTGSSTSTSRSIGRAAWAKWEASGHVDEDALSEAVSRPKTAKKQLQAIKDRTGEEEVLLSRLTNLIQSHKDALEQRKRQARLQLRREEANTVPPVPEPVVTTAEPVGGSSSGSRPSTTRRSSTRSSAARRARLRSAPLRRRRRPSRQRPRRRCVRSPSTRSASVASTRRASRRRRRRSAFATSVRCATPPSAPSRPSSGHPRRSISCARQRRCGGRAAAPPQRPCASRQCRRPTSTAAAPARSTPSPARRPLGAAGGAAPQQQSPPAHRSRHQRRSRSLVGTLPDASPRADDTASIATGMACCICMDGLRTHLVFPCGHSACAPTALRRRCRATSARCAARRSRACARSLTEMSPRPLVQFAKETERERAESESETLLHSGCASGRLGTRRWVRERMRKTTRRRRTCDAAVCGHWP